MSASSWRAKQFAARATLARRRLATSFGEVCIADAAKSLPAARDTQRTRDRRRLAKQYRTNHDTTTEPQ
jgi:hypothetical protein